MTESTFRIKKSRDNSKQELIGGTLDSVHQQVLSKLKEDNLDHTDMNEEIKKLESKLFSRILLASSSDSKVPDN